MLPSRTPTADYARKPNPEWREPQEGVDYVAKESAKWKQVWRTHAPGSDFCVSKGEYQYHLNKDTGMKPAPEQIPFEELEVEWLKEKDRASSGWLTRDSRTQEIVAVVHQEHGWCWRFKLKYNVGPYSSWKKQNGWAWQTLALCVNARIFTCLIECVGE